MAYTENYVLPSFYIEYFFFNLFAVFQVLYVIYFFIRYTHSSITEPSNVNRICCSVIPCFIILVESVLLYLQKFKYFGVCFFLHVIFTFISTFYMPSGFYLVRILFDLLSFLIVFFIKDYFVCLYILYYYIASYDNVSTS